MPAAIPRRTAPRQLSGGAPEYPDALRTATIGGSVEVRFTIDPSGRVVNVRSVTGPTQLRAVAEAAVRRWRYQAGRVGNVAVETETSVNFDELEALDRAIATELSRIKTRLLEIQEEKKAVKQILDGASIRLGLDLSPPVREINLSDLKKPVDQHSMRELP